jgi:hypothetical protein
VAAFGQAVQSDNTSKLFTLGLILPEIYPLMCNSVIILYIKQYRQGIFRLLKAIGFLCLGKRVEPLRVTVTAASQSNA